MDEGIGVNNEQSGNDVDLDELDESTCSDDTYYDIYDNEEERISSRLVTWESRDAWTRKKWSIHEIP